MKKIRFTDEAKYPVPYSPAAATDITKTFARERKRLAEQAEQEKACSGRGAGKGEEDEMMDFAGKRKHRGRRGRSWASLGKLTGTFWLN